MKLKCLCLCAVVLTACATPKPIAQAPTLSASEAALLAKAVADRAQASEKITAAGLLKNIEVLASDAFEGRKPGTSGEDATVNYIKGQFKAVGLIPGSQQGSYEQPVDLIGISSETRLKISVKGQPLLLKQGDDYVAASARFQPDVDVDEAPLLFVGYGVQAPEYGWDDYKGLDVRGKTLVMLINDPPVPDANNPAQLDAKVFKGRGMTYYGRWTYKYDIASKLGAAAVLIVHETEPASYPWAVVRNSWGGTERFELDADHRNLKRVPVQGWLTVEKTRALFAAAGQDFDALKASALSRNFAPVALDATASARVRNTLRSVQSRNVAGRIAGSDPLLGSQHIIYTAHWDHLGRDNSLAGDQIFNGAVDNASGVAGLIEIAKAYQALDTPPKRSILFLAVTAEEQGLLGSRAYAAKPLYPIVDTLADINMDSLNVWGPTQDIQVVGFGQNTLEDVLIESAKAQNRIVVADKSPERGGFYRSDQFEFAKVGVPGLYATSGEIFIGQPADWGKGKRAAYTANDYHKPSDEVSPDWDLSGAARDLQLLFDVGARLSGDSPWPAWKPDSEFRLAREKPSTILKN
ncbi:MAG: M28 family metallopeptidase [Pseudomonadota bacterium]